MACHSLKKNLLWIKNFFSSSWLLNSSLLFFCSLDNRVPSKKLLPWKPVLKEKQKSTHFYVWFSLMKNLSWTTGYVISVLFVLLSIIHPIVFSSSFFFIFPFSCLYSIFLLCTRSIFCFVFLFHLFLSVSSIHFLIPALYNYPSPLLPCSLQLLLLSVCISNYWYPLIDYVFLFTPETVQNHIGLFVMIFFLSPFFFLFYGISC